MLKGVCIVFKKRNYIFLSISPLSRFILEIYLIELDRFFFQFASDFNLTKNLFSKQSKLFISNYKKSIFNYFPIKLQSSFWKENSNLVDFVLNKVKYIKKKLFHQKNEINALFLKKINYVRHLDYLIIGFISSMQLNFSFQKRFKLFVRSNLQLDIKFLKVFSVFDNEIFFLGFNIRLVKSKILKYYPLSKLINNKKYFNRLSSRLTLYKKL